MYAEAFQASLACQLLQDAFKNQHIAKQRSSESVKSRDYRVKMCAKANEEYARELCRTEKENERQHPPLDAGKADLSEVRNQNPKASHVKEEEKEESDLTNVPLTVIVKSEDYEDEEESDGSQCGASSRLAPLSDCDILSSQSADTDERSHETRLQCPQCRITLRSKWDFKVHTGNHAREKPFICSVCGKSFTRKEKLNIHSRTHTGEKPFTCSVCGKGFTHRGHLTLHVGMHTGEKPFSCSVCVKNFTRKTHLNKHMKIHTGEKPFACSVCGLSFSERPGLVLHMRTHTGEKPYSCSVCGKNFSLSRNLTRHRRRHTGEKPFACCACDERFSYKYQMSKHKCAGQKESSQ